MLDTVAAEVPEVEPIELPVAVAVSVALMLLLWLSATLAELESVAWGDLLTVGECVIADVRV